MPRQVQVWEVQPSGMYLLGHQHGLYNGQLGPVAFRDGVPAAPVQGHLVRSTGVGTLVCIWEAEPGHHLEWDGQAWQCLPDAPAPKPEPPKEPAPKKAPAKKKATKKKVAKKSGK